MTDDEPRRTPPLHRAPVPRRGDAPEATADEVSVLLGELSELRLGLTADLGLVAAAVELDAEDVAVEVLEGRSRDLAAFGARSPVRAPRRVRALAPAAPALAAAAALVAVLLGVLPSGGSAPAGRTGRDSSAASFADLYLLHDQSTDPQDVQAAALELHADIARIMAGAAADPQAAVAALQQLAAAAQAIDEPGPPTELDGVIAEAQRLIAALQARVAAVAGRTAALPSLPALRQPVPLPAPGAVALPAPADRSPSAASPAPAATPSATATPAPASPSPAPAPSDAWWPFEPGAGSARSVPPPLR